MESTWRGSSYLCVDVCQASCNEAWSNEEKTFQTEKEPEHPVWEPTPPPWPPGGKIVRALAATRYTTAIDTVVISHRHPRDMLKKIPSFAEA